MKRPLKYSLLTAALLLLPLALYGLDDWSFDITDHGSFGASNYLVNQSLGVGYNNLAYAPYSKNAVIGFSLQNYQSYNLTVGQYNTSVTGDLFTVGNGSSNTARANSLTVSDSGVTGVVNIHGTAEIATLNRKGGILNFSGTAPAWWSSTEYGFLTSSADTVNSPANIGQLKYIASRAKMYLDSRFSAAGGAGSEIDAMCSFSNSDNYAPVAVGQLKNVATAFYDRLVLCGYNWELKNFSTASTPYPWPPGTGPVHPENAAPATTGQLKQAFSFDVDVNQFLTSIGSDGIPLWWSKFYNLPANSTDADGDGLTNFQEWQFSQTSGHSYLNPNNAFSAGSGNTGDNNRYQGIGDADKDGLSDVVDAVPDDPLLTFLKVPESRYAVLDLGPGTANSINASGQILRGWQTPDMVNHADVITPGSTQAPKVVDLSGLVGDPKITRLIGLSDNGTAFILANRDYTIETATNQPPPPGTATISGGRSVYKFDGSSPTTAMPVPAEPDGAKLPPPWLPWTLTDLNAEGPVTGLGSLFNGGYQKKSKFKAVGNYYTVVQEAQLSSLGFSWTSTQGFRASPNWANWGIPTLLLLGNNTVPGTSGNIPEGVIGEGWCSYGSVSREGDGVSYSQAEDLTYSFSFSRDLDNAYGFSTSESIPPSMGISWMGNHPLAVMSIPVGYSSPLKGPIIITENGSAIVRTKTGWKLTHLRTGALINSNYSPPNLSGVSLPHPLGRNASVANARGEFLCLNTLWRNGATHQLGDLLPPGTSFAAADMNENGLICGTLFKADGPHAAVLLPVEVVGNSKNPTAKLNVGKMSESGVLSGTGATATLDVDKDPDRFFVRVLGGAALGGISVKVSTADNTDSAYNDNTTQIDLQSDGGDAISKSMLLVSDDIDDDYAVDSIADDATGDRTHKIQLGGNFKIEEIKIGTANWQTEGTKVPVPIGKTVNIGVVILRNKSQMSGGTPVVAQGDVEQDLKLGNERYAQAGIKLSWTISAEDPPAGVDLSNGLTEFTAPGAPSAEESSLLTSSLATATTADLQVFYVNNFAPAPGSAGEAFPEAAFTGPLGGNVIISAARKPFTLPHELGHILKNDDGVSNNGGHSSDPIHLMRSGTSTINTLGASKRLTTSEATTVRGSKYAQ